MRKIIPIGEAGYIGASLSAMALGLSTFGTPYDAWLRFKGEAPEPTAEERERMDMGHELEPWIAKQIERIWGVKTHSTKYAYVDPEHPWLICHPDRIAKTADGITFPIEIKSASSFSARKWGSEDTDEIPYQYLIQCYQYFRTGVPNPGWMWQITFSDNKLHRHVVRRDRELEDRLFSKLIDIVENRWMKGFPPEPSSYEEATRIWNAPTEGAIEADAAIYTAYSRLKDIGEKKKAIEAEENTLKKEIVEYMQGRGLLMYQGSKLMTYRKVTSERFDSKAFRKDHPELADEYTKETSYMTLRG